MVFRVSDLQSGLKGRQSIVQLLKELKEVEVSQVQILLREFHWSRVWSQINRF